MIHLALFTTLLTSTVMAQPMIIPQPTTLELQTGTFTIQRDTLLWTTPATQAVGTQLTQRLAPAMGWPLRMARLEQAKSHGITLTLDSANQDLGPEAYHLTVTPERIDIQAAQPAGLFYGIQTLLQLLPVEIFQATPATNVTWTVPCLTIEDHPRFTWRGMHLDTGRHFMPKAFIKKYIDLLALHKFNRFHWHLTEDQGWRIEIKQYPKLTEVGAWRKETLIGHAGENPARYDGQRHGGFYTQDDIRDIVAYARERFVTVMPEIEMPGHSQAAIAAYPELGVTDKSLEAWTQWGVSDNILNADEATITFYQNILTEVMVLFDSEFIHIGGDEAPKKQWQASDAVQTRIKELGLANEHELQSWFIKQMDRFLADHDRRLVGWDEILEGGLAPGATVMSWRGEAGGIAAAQAGHDVIMTPTSHTYLDYYQADPQHEPLAIGGFLPLEKVYSYDPVPTALTEEQARHILGVQGQVWTEYIPTPEHAEYMAFPRACALAEVAWTPVKQKNFTDFQQRLRQHVQRLAHLNVNFRPLD